MSDLIKREDAITAVAVAVLDDRDELEALKALPSADAVSLEEHIKELNDLAVAWKAKFAKAEKITNEIYDETMAKVANECEECKERLQNLRPSAEAETTVIRSRTLMPTKDFKEWAKRVREVNPNATVIPCDAEVVSAEAVQGWIPCSERLPNVGENVLFTTDIYGGYVAEGDRRADGKWWQYRWNALIQNEEVIAWMPLPKPYGERRDP